MEIFQNMWTALTTENVVLTNLITYVLIFVEVTITMFLFTTLLNIKNDKKQKILYVIMFSIISILTNIFVPTPFNTFINLLICPVLVMIIFKTNLLKAILAEFLPFIIFNIITIPLHSICVTFFNVTNEGLMFIPLLKASFAITSYVLVYIIYRVLKYFNINIYILDDLRTSVNSTLLINFIFGIFAVFVQTYIAMLYNDKLPPFIALLNLSVLFVYFMFSLYSLARTNKLETTKRDLEQSNQYNKTLTILHDNIRCFKHDFSNIVTTIGGYVHTGDLEGLRNYYNELLGDCQKVNNLSALSPSVINDPAIYSLLTNKYHLADEKGITINLEIFLDLTTLNVKTYEFTRILRYFNG